jgi:hypothetical protein
MKIYQSTEYVPEPKVKDMQLKVNSMWNFSSRAVCFKEVEKNLWCRNDNN